ncbi:hypothetical protein V8F20_009622 [Naviculisporaceae sp. PSN 640]
MSIPAPSWGPAVPIPRLLQKLFDTFPLMTYEPNELPARAQSAVSTELPTLYVFSSEEDARQGLPSFNPACLKWQTFLKLSKIQFVITPSNNHASPTGSLPFLLPPRDPSPLSSLHTIKPIPSTKLYEYALSQAASKPTPPKKQQQPAAVSLRQEAYQSLIDVSLRNAFLYTLYLDPANSALLDKLYIEPATSSSVIRNTLRYQLRRAAEAEILKTTHSVSSGGGAQNGLVNPGEIYRLAKEALEALAGELSSHGKNHEKGEEEEGGPWFFEANEPGLFDVSVFAYTFLMVKFFSSSSSSSSGGVKANGNGNGNGNGTKGQQSLLGEMVKSVGNGELIRHMNRILELTWPELLYRDRE